MAEADTKQTSEEVSWADNKSGLGSDMGMGVAGGRRTVGEKTEFKS